MSHLAEKHKNHVLSFFTGHSDRVGGVAWHPQATLSQAEDLVNLVSGGGEGNVLLWSLNGYGTHTQVSTFLTHTT